MGAVVVYVDPEARVFGPSRGQGTMDMYVEIVEIMHERIGDGGYEVFDACNYQVPALFWLCGAPFVPRRIVV